MAKKSEGLIGTTEYLSLQVRCRINQCRYNRVQLYKIYHQRNTKILLRVRNCDDFQTAACKS